MESLLENVKWKIMVSLHSGPLQRALSSQGVAGTRALHDRAGNDKTRYLDVSS